MRCGSSVTNASRILEHQSEDCEAAHLPVLNLGKFSDWMVHKYLLDFNPNSAPRQHPPESRKYDP